MYCMYKQAILSKHFAASPRGDGAESIYDMDGYQTQQSIKYSEFQREKWQKLLDATGRELLVNDSVVCSHHVS